MERKLTGEGNEAERLAPKWRNDEQITDDIERCRPKVAVHFRADSVHEDRPTMMNPGCQKPEEAVPVEYDSPPPPSTKGQVPEVDVELTMGSTIVRTTMSPNNDLVSVKAKVHSHQNNSMLPVTATIQYHGLPNSGAARLPEKNSGSPPIETSKKEPKDHPLDLGKVKRAPTVRSSTNSSSCYNPSETETNDSDVDSNGRKSELDHDGENANVGANMSASDSDLEDIAPSCVSSASSLRPDTRNDEQIADKVEPSDSVVPAAEILGDESPMELGSESDTSEEPMDCSPQSSPARPRQAAEMAPELQIREDDPCEKSAFSFANPSLWQEAGPSGGSRELAASIAGVARPWNTSSSPNGVAHPRGQKSDSSPIKISKKELIDRPGYTSSSSSGYGDENGANGPNLVEDSVHDMSFLAKVNLKKLLLGVPRIPPAQGTSSDSD